MAKINYTDKTQSAPYDGLKWNAQDANEVKASVNELYNTLGYKSLILKIGGSDTNNHNDLKVSLVKDNLPIPFEQDTPDGTHFSRTDVGIYNVGCNSSLFLDGRTICTATSPETNDIFNVSFYRGTDYICVINIWKLNVSTGDFERTDDFENLFIEIKLFN